MLMTPCGYTPEMVSSLPGRLDIGWLATSNLTSTRNSLNDGYFQAYIHLTLY